MYLTRYSDFNMQIHTKNNLRMLGVRQAVGTFEKTFSSPIDFQSPFARS